MYLDPLLFRPIPRLPPFSTPLFWISQERIEARREARRAMEHIFALALALAIALALEVRAQVEHAIESHEDDHGLLAAADVDDEVGSSKLDLGIPPFPCGIVHTAHHDRRG